MKKLFFPIPVLLILFCITCSNSPQKPMITGIDQAFGPTSVTDPKFRPKITLLGSGFHPTQTQVLVGDHVAEGVSVNMDAPAGTKVQFVLPENPKNPGPVSIKVVNLETGEFDIKENFFTYYLGVVEFSKEESPLSISGTPSSFTVGDFDNDAKHTLDLAVVFSESMNNKIDFLWGNGSGGFTKNSMIQFSYGNDAHPHIAAADFDKDGRPDLVTMDATGNKLYILPQSMGGFQSALTLDVGPSPNFVITEDFNGDGYIDVATANKDMSNQARMSVLMNDYPKLKMLAFLPAIQLPLPDDPQFLLSADLNQDARPDLIALTSTNPAMYVLKNTTVTSSVTFDKAGQKLLLESSFVPQAGVTGPLLNQKHPDVMLVGTHATERFVSIFKNQGNTSDIQLTKLGTKFPTSGQPSDIPASTSFVDLDKDGYADLVVHTKDQISILLNRGREGHGVDFYPPVNISASFPITSTVVSDFTADGQSDIIGISKDGKKIVLFKNTSR